MAETLWGSEPRGNSRVRNSLRRLVAYGLVERYAAGTYKITSAGARVVKRWFAENEQKVVVQRGNHKKHKHAA